MHLTTWYRIQEVETGSSGRQEIVGLGQEGPDEFVELVMLGNKRALKSQSTSISALQQAEGHRLKLSLGDLVT